MEEKINLATQAYDILKQQILRLELLPGMPVSDHILANKINMSRTPIRQALAKLEQDGLVEKMENSKKMMVSKIRIADVKDMHELRNILEGKAVEIIYRKGGLSEAEKNRLQKINEDFKYYVSTKELIKNFQADDLFHLELMKLTGNQYLIEFLETLQVRMIRSRFLTLFTPNHHQESVMQHNEILESYLHGTMEETQALIQEHLEGAVQNYVEILKNNL